MAGGGERRRRRLRRAPRTEPYDATDPAAPEPDPAPAARPAAASPAHLAELAGSFALTAGVLDPEPAPEPDQRYEEAHTERGLRGLIGGGSSQVGVAAAMRARDSARPTDADLAAAERNLPIVRRGWIPRDDLPRPGAQRHG
jgi:hypothetical protein